MYNIEKKSCWQELLTKRSERTFLKTMPTISSADRWNVGKILANGHKHIIGEAIISVIGLVAGSKIRRTGHKGMMKWANVWKSTGKGFDVNEAYIRVYVDEGPGLLRLLALAEIAQKKYERAGLSLPVTGANMGRLISVDEFVVVCVIDGMHRTLTLQEAVALWLKKNPDTDVKTCPFYWIRAVFYHPDVKPMMAVLAKASNDQKQVHVQEDIWERMTVTNQVIEGYEKYVSDGGSFSQSKIARHYMDQIGCPNNANAVNYHVQLCQMAMTLKPVQQWVTDKLNTLEERGGSHAEVMFGILFFIVFVFVLIEIHPKYCL